ncbi:hypothetical protein HPB47_012088, partial [Ixodes persulcatus]
VVVPPSAPVGPLVVESVTEDSVRLSWKQPLKDGGDPVRNYLVEYRDVSAAEIAKFSVRTPDARTSFTVEDLRTRHFYVFRISAENEAGTGEALVDKKPVRVQAAPKKPPAPEPPVVVIHPTMPDACIVTWSPPCDDITWYIVERCDLVGDVWIVVSQQKEAQFVAQNLVPGIEYSFRVSAENEVGMGKWSKPSEPIVIIRKVASMTAPEFTKELSDCDVLVDNDATFTCKFIGIPTPEITWYKSGHEIYDSGRTEIDTSLATSTLLLRKVRLEDKGKIECQALNNAGLKTTSAKLTVLAPPKLTGSPTYKDGLMFDSGETVRVKLSYTGHPPPDFTWRRNGEIVVFDGSSAAMLVDRDDQTVLLKLVDADPNHRGMYTLEATNEHGSDQFSVAVMITGEPEPPEGKPVVTSVDWNSCTLSWNPSANDGGSPVSSYIIERRQMNNELWMKATTAHQEHCTVYGLIEGGQYAFRVRAVTVYGTSKPSQSSEPVTLLRLGPESRAESLPMETNSTEATEAIATEQDFASTADDATLTVTKYDSDDQRSSLDVDEFLNEDAAASETVSQWRPQGPLGLRTEDRRFYYYPDAQYYKTQARLKEFDMRTRRPYTRRITSLSKTIESDYSHRKSNMDRLAKKISSEMSSLERDLELLHSMQSMLRRELKTREKPTGEQTNGKTSNGRKSEGSPDTTRARPYPDASSRPYLSRRLSRSDSSESDEPVAGLPRPKPVPKGEAPRFITRLENRIAPSGYRVKLHCTVVGDPTPQVTWLKNGVKVSLENRQISINHQDYGLCSLEIFNLKPADTGEYTCTATNAYGEATTSAYLRVTEEGSSDFQEERRRLEKIHVDDRRSVPGPPLDPVVTESGPTSATLAWTKPISNGGHPITGYRIQYREVPSKQWRDKATSRICVCDIYGLKPQ